MKQRPRPHNPNALRTTWTVKLSSDEVAELEPKVLKHFAGNRSEYIRAALMAYKPRNRVT
jgi:Arc/MetJ-type ribon-helix-helix transcriptional regulator